MIIYLLKYFSVLYFNLKIWSNKVYGATSDWCDSLNFKNKSVYGFSVYACGMMSLRAGDWGW